ncbi:hypothetical protein [Microbulbifer magnicolonia]|uniref:hypothetical protein n=1 Tax=Microbulbifer magnicolonia TaxID=3109744 RepID=UPI002B410C85|nr:hypothetical protein [Microbulbifer sp. GG15]
MKILRILLRRTLAIALLSVPTEVLPGEDRKIALTFSDNSVPGTSETLLDELDRLQIKATYCPDDEQKRVQQPSRAIADAARGAVKKGDAPLGLVELATPQGREVIAGAARILRELHCDDLTLVHSSFSLPPLPGTQVGAGMPAEEGILPPDVDTAMDDPQAIADYLTENAFPGAIVLLQPVNGQRRQAANALPLIRERLHAEGYRFVTLSELIEEDSAGTAGDG